MKMYWKQYNNSEKNRNVIEEAGGRKKSWRMTDPVSLPTYLFQSPTSHFNEDNFHINVWEEVKDEEQTVYLRKEGKH